MQDPLVHPPEPGPEVRERDHLLGVVAEDVRRDHVQQRLDRLADHLQVVAVLVVRIGIVLRVPRDHLLVLPVVLGEQQVVAVESGRERRRHQERHEAVLHQLEVLDDLGPEQAQRVRERREPEAGAELLGDRGATDEVPPLEDEDLEAGLGEVRPVHEAVVTTADDDRVVRPIAAGRGARRCGAAVLPGPGRLGRGHRHVRPSFAPGCRAAAARRARRPAHSGGRR
jgi:hypothetical protein